MKGPGRYGGGNTPCGYNVVDGRLGTERGGADGESRRMRGKRRRNCFSRSESEVRTMNASISTFLHLCCYATMALVAGGGPVGAATSETVAERANRGLVEVMTSDDAASIDHLHRQAPP